MNYKHCSFENFYIRFLILMARHFNTITFFFDLRDNVIASKNQFQLIIVYNYYIYINFNIVK
jgi:hypothetical protein